METIRTIKGSGGYSLSNMGECFSPYGKKLKLDTSGGYDTYTLIKEGKRNKVSVSKLMRETYPYEWIKYLQEGEEVKPLKEYPGYFITTRGRVWSSMRWNFLTLNSTDKYYYSMRIGGREGITYNIHTLVGRNFLPEYREGLLILHKEETLSYPEINYVENLWVGTKKDNSVDMYRKGREKHHTKRCEVSGRYVV